MLLNLAFAVPFYTNQAKANQRVKSKIPGTDVYNGSWPRGYYVSTNPHQHVGKGETVLKTDENKSVTTAQSEETEDLAATKPATTIQEDVNASDVSSIVQQNDAAPARLDDASSTERTFSLNTFTKEIPMMKQIDSTVKKIKSHSNESSRGDGLSLIWIVILVLLILWILGLLGGGWGLGGLINILLVIALILLILWLLRII